MSIFSRARRARSTLNQLNQAQPPQPSVAQRLFTRVQQAQQQLGQQNPQPAPMVPPPGMPQVSPFQTGALTQLLSQARMQSPDIGALPQGMSSLDPRAIAANPQGFEQYMSAMRQQEAQMPGSTMLGNTSSGTFGPQMSPFAQAQLEAQRGMSSGGLGMQQQIIPSGISPFAQAGYEAQMAGPNPYTQGLGSSSSPFAQAQLEAMAQRGMSSSMPSGMLGGGLGALSQQSPFGGGQQSAFGNLQGAFGGGQQSPFGGQQSPFGGQQSAFSNLQSPFGGQQSALSGGLQGAFGSPQQSPFGSPQQSPFGSPQQSPFGGGPTQQAQGPTGQQAPRPGLF